MEKLALTKSVGRIKNLEALIPEGLHLELGIGHTRWAYSRRSLTQLTLTLTKASTNVFILVSQWSYRKLPRT